MSKKQKGHKKATATRTVRQDAKSLAAIRALRTEIRGLRTDVLALRTALVHAEQTTNTGAGPTPMPAATANSTDADPEPKAQPEKSWTVAQLRAELRHRGFGPATGLNKAQLLERLQN